MTQPAQITNLKFWRIVNGLSIVEAAKRLSMSPLTLNYLERARLCPSDRDLKRLREVFGDCADHMLDLVNANFEETTRT